MLAPFLLMAISPCADPGFCPTKREFITAVADHDFHRLWDMNAAANQNSDQLTLVMQRRIRRVTHLQCGKPEGSPRSVACTALYDYGDGPTLRSFRLSRTAGGWHAEGDTP